ncbi:MAG: aldehyde reductase [Solirubrobacteraceae bacterium]
MRTVLVTGGAGFLGSWCVIDLLRRGYVVRATVRDLAREPALRAVIAREVEAGDHLSVVAADLREEACWERAVEGCDYVLHVASPFPSTQPKDPDELIVPAREGTLRVLRAGLDAGVERVVVTSSIAAITGGLRPGSLPLTEEDWSDPDNPKLTPYALSKTLAERAAWNFVRERGEIEKLAVVNPGAILGPVLSDDRSSSIGIIERLLRGMPGVPRIGFNTVDVRDVADLQFRAMSAPEAAGERFIAVESFKWMEEVAEILRDHLGETAAAKVPRRTVPNPLVRAMALFDSSIRSIVGQLGRRTETSSEKAETLLGWSPRPSEETILDCAQSLIDKTVFAKAGA